MSETYRAGYCGNCGKPGWQCDCAQNVYGRHRTLGEAIAAGPMSETFKPGQTVFRKSDGQRLVVTSGCLATDHLLCMDANAYLVCPPLTDITAVDPNAEPEPQKCPHCGSSCHIFEDPWYVSCANSLCQASGPVKPTRLEAVGSWNSTRIIQPGEFTNDLRQALKKAAADCEFKPADYDPLTVEEASK